MSRLLAAPPENAIRKQFSDDLISSVEYQVDRLMAIAQRRIHSAIGVPLSGAQGIAAFGTEINGNIEAVAFSIPIPTNVESAKALNAAWRDIPEPLKTSISAMVRKATYCPLAVTPDFSEIVGCFAVAYACKQGITFEQQISFIRQAHQSNEVPAVIGLLNGSGKCIWLATAIDAHLTIGSST